MMKSLNLFDIAPKLTATAGRAIGPNLYHARMPRLAFGFIGAALAAVTIAVSVILPARVDSAGREPQMHLASQAIPAASSGTPAITSITVVAAREPRSSTTPLRSAEAATSRVLSGETTASAILRISTAAR
jgi:hypothetical protein